MDGIEELDVGVELREAMGKFVQGEGSLEEIDGCARRFYKSRYSKKLYQDLIARLLMAIQDDWLNGI